MKKRERLALIKELVTSQEIDTQQELLRLLQERGLQLTQATVSRDMNELGITKVPSQAGHYSYGLPKPKPVIPETSPAPAKASILFVSAQEEGLASFLNIAVVPGSSLLVKRYLLETFPDQIFSLIADDDSLLLLAKSSHQAEEIRQTIQSWY